MLSSPKRLHDPVFAGEVQQAQEEVHLGTDLLPAHPVDAAEVAQGLRYRELGVKGQFLEEMQ